VSSYITQGYPSQVKPGRFRPSLEMSVVPPKAACFQRGLGGPKCADIVDKGIFDRWP
jgi:hypothetical protein